MIRALIFDFDGLILDTETPVLEAWAAMHREAGVEYIEAEAAKIVGHIDMAYDPWLRFDPSYDRAELHRKHRERSRAMLAAQKILPGVFDYLEEATRRGLRLAVASNSDHGWVDPHLERLGLRKYFELTRCREDVPRGKPEPDVYQAVLDAFGIAGREAIAFEDSEPGSLAATRAGIWNVVVPNPSTKSFAFAHAHVRLTSLAEQPLSSLLERFA
ncbi:MAG TPA: HAD-IA family hydrolase [Opitutaceae bacterium]|nr:HAD-IA family hydrolase [Opitutaceae bacterium]